MLTQALNQEDMQCIACMILSLGTTDDQNWSEFLLSYYVLW